MLLDLINNLLLLNRMDAKKMNLNLSTFKPDEIIAHTRSYAEDLARQNHRVEVSWRVEESLPEITTDAMKLEEILQNLIGNAFKFTPRGRIEMRARNLSGQDRIEFSVMDTGVGISREDRERIFEEFRQVGESPEGAHGGVGLGLSIVKGYLELMGGEIRVESEPGGGSTFTFTIPYSIQNPAGRGSQ